MINSNLVLLLSKFSSIEFRELGEFIRSSFFNKNEGVVKLYDFIKIHYPDLEKMNFEKEYVYTKLFPGIEFDDAFMRKLMFNLTRLAEDYLVYKSTDSKSFYYSKVLIDEFLKRDLQKNYVKKLRSLEEEFKKQKIHDVEYYKNKFQIDAFNEIIFTQDRVITNSKDKPEKYIIENTRSMVNYFLISILEEYRFLITYRKVIKFNFDPEFHKLVLSYLKKNETEHNVPLISLYLSSILLILDRDEDCYTKTKMILINDSGSLSHSDKYSTYAILVNFANDEYQKGIKKYLKESFELYQLILENRLYSGVEGGAFYNPLFRNIVNVGLLMKETEWTQNFIKKYINKLMPEARDNTLHLSNARVNFAKGNYDRSLEDLSKIVSIHHFQLKPLIKSITLMIYIEKGWLSEAVDLIDAYRHYISYEKLLPDISKEKNMNFIKFCNEIIKLKSKRSKEKISDARYDLMNTANTLEKEWLEEKIGELEKYTGI